MPRNLLPLSAIAVTLPSPPNFRLPCQIPVKLLPFSFSHLYLNTSGFRHAIFVLSIIASTPLATIVASTPEYLSLVVDSPGRGIAVAVALEREKSAHHGRPQGMYLSTLLSPPPLHTTPSMPDARRRRQALIYRPLPPFSTRRSPLLDYPVQKYNP